MPSLAVGSAVALATAMESLPATGEATTIPITLITLKGAMAELATVVVMEALPTALEAMG
jgi:hypothetical protein